MRRTVISLGLVWLTAFNLRVILFAIPPSLPAIRSDLGLSFSATGSITSLAVLTLGVASIPGALLATRYGARRLVSLCAAGLVIFTVTITLPPGAFWVFTGSALVRDRRVWQVAALFTFQNLVYYTVATWVPFLLAGRDAGYVATTFLFLNFFPIVPLFALSFVRWPYALSTPFYVVAGTLAVTGSLGLLLGLTDFVQPLVFMVGLGTAAAFVASIALPPLIARDESEASTYSAVMYTAGYLLAFVGPLSAGMLVDATGSVELAFWPPVAGAILMAVVGSLAPRPLARSPGAGAR